MTTEEILSIINSEEFKAELRAIVEANKWEDDDGVDSVGGIFEDALCIDVIELFKSKIK